jgi:TRAP-type C4-dicarboxylate transport system permease small subunit
MTERHRPKPKGFRRLERWLVGVAFAVMAFVLEKVVMRSVRRKGTTEPEEVTTMISKGGEVDVDL